MPDTTTYRLTEADETAITTRMTETAAQWRRESASGRLQASWAPTLERIGYHAIGCTADDLRDSELEWISTKAAKLLNG